MSFKKIYSFYIFSRIAIDDEIDRTLHNHNADCFLLRDSLLLNYNMVRTKTGWEGNCAIFHAREISI